MRKLAAAAAALLVLAACGAEGGAPSGSSSPQGEGGELIVQAASFDLAAGEESRFIVGLLTPEELFVSHGSVDVEFFYLGTREGQGTAVEGPTATAEFLPIEGPEEADGPVAGPPSVGRGVYATEVTFDKAGFWAAQVTANLEGGSLSGRSIFEVYEEHRIPAVGDPAPRSENLILGDRPREGIDSRARDEPVPDPSLHRMTVADVLDAGEPALVVVSTPVYCQSRFCGPITDMVEDLAARYDDRARFIHIEVWRNFEGQVLNRAAADWIYREGELQEPWVFLVGADGKIAARWDNVATPREIVPHLKDLPPLR